MSMVKTGFVGFGEVNSPKELIVGKCRNAKNLLEMNGLQLVYTEPVSDDAQGLDVARAISDLSKEDFDCLVVCIAGWIPTHAVINVISEFSHKPMVLWGLTGYYEGGRLLTTADQAGTSALRKVMEDMDFNFKYIYDSPGKKSNAESVARYAKAASAARLLKRSRIGMMGYRDMNLYGTLFEGVSLKSKIGPEIEIFEMLEISQYIDQLNQDDIKSIVTKVKREWEFETPATEASLETGAKYYLALRQKVSERHYDALSVIDVDGMKKLAKFPPSMVLMLLTNELNLCTTPENDSLGAVTQLITKYLTGQISAYLEFYEFMEDRVLMGVPDYIPAAITDGNIKVYPAAFGGFSEGILNVSKVKTGKVTLCRLTSRGEKYSMHLLTGTAVEPRKWEEAGWQQPAPQLPSVEVILDVPVEEFAQKVLSQHYIITYGDHTEIIKDLCRILNIEIM